MITFGIMSAQAGFTLIDDFEGYAPGSDLVDASAWAMTETKGTGTPATIENDGSSNVARLAGVDGAAEGHTNYSIDLGANTIDTLGTFYFETTQNVGAGDAALTFMFADTSSSLWGYAGAVIFTAGPRRFEDAGSHQSCWHRGLQLGQRHHV